MRLTRFGKIAEFGLSLLGHVQPAAGDLQLIKNRAFSIRHSRSQVKMQALAANRAGNMDHLARPDGRNRATQLREERSVKPDLVALHVNNHDSK